MAIRSAKFLAVGLYLLAALAGCGLSGDPQSMIAKAQELRQKSNYKAAIIELKNALQKDNTNSEARFLLGTIYIDAREYTAAEQELRRALELSYERSKVMPALGKSLLMQGEFQKVIDQVPVDSHASAAVQSDVLTLRARALTGLGRTNQARELLEAAISKQPNFTDALIEQARLASLDQKQDEALQLIDRAISATPKQVDAWLLKSDILRLKRDEAGSLAASRKAIEIAPSNVAARLQMASLYIATNKLDAARKMVGEMLGLEPGNILVVHMKALLAYRSRDFKAANDDILQVLKAAPDYMPSVLLAGAVLFELGAHEQAQAHLARAVQVAPQNLFAIKLLALSQAHSGQAQRAVETLNQGLKLTPDDPGLLTVAGELYMQNGEYAKAVKYFEAAAKGDPNSVAVRANLGMSRLAAGESARAVADLESAVAMDAANYHTDMMLIATHLERGNFDQALQATEALEKKQPNNPLTYYIKATAYLAKKDHPNARKGLERAVELQPTFWQATTTLVELDLLDKNSKSARRRLETLLERDKNNLPALVALAELGPRIEASQKERVGWLERAIKVNPKLAEPQLMLARLYGQMGEGNKALEAAQLAVAGSPTNPAAVELVGELQQRAGLTNQAITTYGELVKLQPKSPNALYRLAIAQANGGGGTAASATLKQALALKPDFMQAHEALVGISLREKRFSEALTTARRVQKDYPKSPVGFALEGDVSMAEKKFDQAIKAYDASFQMSKSNGMLLKLYRAYESSGKADDGDMRLDQWLKASPGDTVVRMFAASRALRRGNYKNAVAHYELAQQSNPEDAIVLNDLAWAYYKASDARALPTAERAGKLAPNNAIVMDTMGWILVDQGDAKRGTEMLVKAAKALPKNPEIGFHLAQAWIKSGEKAKGREELERVLALNIKFPQFAEAQSLSKQLGK